MRFYLHFFLLFTVISSCKDTGVREGGEIYFDLEQFFKREASLNHSRILLKTVTRNNITETETLRAVNWEKELSPFIESDLNKPAWINSFQKKTNKDSSVVIYLSEDPKTDVKKVEIIMNEEAPSSIIIYKNIENLLFSHRQTLTYYKDSLFIITGAQQVTLLGTTTYEITGNFDVNF